MLSNLKILVADDDFRVRTIYALILEREGFSVTVAKDGSEAVSKFIEERPKIVILDNSMPKYSGLQAAKEILTLAPSTKIMMATAESKVLPEAELLGIDIFLLKPVSIRKLLDSVMALSEVRPTCKIVAR